MTLIFTGYDGGKEKKMKNIATKVSMVILLAAFGLAACAQMSDQPAAAAPSATLEPAGPIATYAGYDIAELTGVIYSAGSSTVYPLSLAIAENFQLDGFAGEIKIDSIGSGAGFERFCKTGESDISNASRAIKSSEIESCAAINRTPIEFRVGTDAIAVVVSQENDFVSDITLEELAAIFTGAVLWSDVRADWPAQPIQRFIPGTDSGTFDFFIEEAIQKTLEIEELDEAKSLALSASNQQASEDDNVLVQGVLNSPFAVGYFGFAYYINNTSTLKALSIDGVIPNEVTAEGGSYTLSRPLFIYSDATIINEKPHVAAFIDYYLQTVNDIVLEVGYFPASDASLEASIQAFEEALK